MASEKICRAIATTIKGESTVDGKRIPSSVTIFAPEDGREIPTPIVIHPDENGKMWYWTPATEEPLAAE